MSTYGHDLDLGSRCLRCGHAGGLQLRLLQCIFVGVLETV